MNRLCERKKLQLIFLFLTHYQGLHGFVWQLLEKVFLVLQKHFFLKRIFFLNINSGKVSLILLSLQASTPQPTNCLSLFDHIVGLPLKVLSLIGKACIISHHSYTCVIGLKIFDINIAVLQGNRLKINIYIFTSCSNISEFLKQWENFFFFKFMFLVYIFVLVTWGLERHEQSYISLQSYMEKILGFQILLCAVSRKRSLFPPSKCPCGSPFPLSTGFSLIVINSMYV